jgi:hypothetical protein
MCSPTPTWEFSTGRLSMLACTRPVLSASPSNGNDKVSDCCPGKDSAAHRRIQSQAG